MDLDQWEKSLEISLRGRQGLSECLRRSSEPALTSQWAPLTDIKTTLPTLTPTLTLEVGWSRMTMPGQTPTLKAGSRMTMTGQIPPQPQPSPSASFSFSSSSQYCFLLSDLWWQYDDIMVTLLVIVIKDKVCWMKGNCNSSSIQIRLLLYTFCFVV